MYCSACTAACDCEDALAQTLNRGQSFAEWVTSPLDTALIDVADRKVPTQGGEPVPLLRIAAGSSGTVRLMVGGWLENILKEAETA